VASDATAFTDEVLVLGLIERVDDVGDAGGTALQSFAAKALMTRTDNWAGTTDNAVDAAVSARSRGRLMAIDHHRRGIVSRGAVLRIHMDANGENCQQDHQNSSHLVITAN